MTARQAALLLASRERVDRLGGTGYIRPPTPPPPMPCARPTWGRLIPALVAIAALIYTITAAHAAGGR